jgi:aminoglycoside phosphotransferase (APT) family kinase protein
MRDDRPAMRDALARWLGRGDVSVEQIAGGASNLTYRVQAGGDDWILRRPPAVTFATSNDMAREWTVLRALAATAVPVPRVIRTCEDPGILGVPFYVMERLDGIVFRTGADVAHLDEAQSRACADELADVLAALHAIDPAAVGLASFGRPEGFVERQVRRWATQWEAAKFADVKEIDEVARRLAATVPPPAPAAIVHGDYSFNNTVYFRDPPTRLQGVLDWELSTLGDPLTDLGMLALYWGDVAAPVWSTPLPQHARPGFGTTGELLERYARASGRDLSRIGFYIALATFKMAVITAGARARVLRGDPARAAALEEKSRLLATIALEATGHLRR